MSNYMDDTCTLACKMLDALIKKGLRPKLNKSVLNNAFELLNDYSVDDIDFGILKGFTNNETHIFITLK